MFSVGLFRKCFSAKVAKGYARGRDKKKGFTQRAQEFLLGPGNGHAQADQIFFGGAKRAQSFFAANPA